VVPRAGYAGRDFIKRFRLDVGLWLQLVSVQLELLPRQLDLFRASHAPPWRAQLRAESLATPEVAEAHLLPSPPEPPSRQEVLARSSELAQRVARFLGPAFRVHLTVHDNGSTMVSFRRQPPLLKVRVHHMFLDAPEPVVEALADFAGRGVREAGKVLDDFIASRQERIRVLPRRSAPLRSRGRCFDLKALFDELNHRYFQGGIRARIGWGRQSGRRRRKSIRLGVYDHKAREIRVHPALDRPDVPRFFVEYIVFHEMLHQLFPSDRHTGRHVHHPRAFRDRERAFPRYEAALAWEKQHLHRLLRG
jgi:hypothetical protein